MPDKVKMEFRIPKSKTLEHNGIDFQVNPWLSIELQAFLINKYLESYFSEGSIVYKTKWDLITSEANLFSHIIQLCTNIEADSITNELLSDEVLFSKITTSISGYGDFRIKLEKVLDEVKEQIRTEKSVGAVIDKLAQKAIEILNNIEALSPEQIEKMKNDTYKLLSEVQKSSVYTATQPQPISKAKRGRKQLIQ